METGLDKLMYVECVFIYYNISLYNTSWSTVIKKYVSARLFQSSLFSNNRGNVCKKLSSTNFCRNFQTCIYKIKPQCDKGENAKHASSRVKKRLDNCR